MKSKLKKVEISIIMISIAFACFAIGYFVGTTKSGNTMNVSLEKSSTAEDYAEAFKNEVETDKTDVPKNDDSVENVNNIETIADDVININTANAKELDALPGIGEVLSNRIVEYRNEHGAFKSKQEIMNVNGIGEKIYAQIEDKISVE